MTLLTIVLQGDREDLNKFYQAYEEKGIDAQLCALNGITVLSLALTDEEATMEPIPDETVADVVYEQAREDFANQQEAHFQGNAYRFGDATHYYIDRPKQDDWKDAFDNGEETVPAYVDAEPLEFNTSSIDKKYEVQLRIARALERIAENTDSVADYFDLRYTNDNPFNQHGPVRPTKSPKFPGDIAPLPHM